MVTSTDAYYEANAKNYFKNTAFIDLSKTCLRFLAYVRPGGRIADLGCGSGRDLLFFKSLGYKAEGIDSSPSLCRLAREYSGAEVACVRIEDWKPGKRFDGLWACASLLHLRLEAVDLFFGNLTNVLEKNGAAFFSFKTCESAGTDKEGRYFTAFSSAELSRLLNAHPELVLLEQWESEDTMGRSSVVWLSFILGLS